MTRDELLESLLVERFAHPAKAKTAPRVLVDPLAAEHAHELDVEASGYEVGRPLGVVA